MGTSSRAIHGGAYFSAVSGRKFNLTTVLRPCRPLACCWMFFSRPLSLLYWISLNCQVPWGWHCIFRWICLQNAKMDLSRAVFFICSTYPHAQLFRFEDQSNILICLTTTRSCFINLNLFFVDVLEFCLRKRRKQYVILLLNFQWNSF